MGIEAAIIGSALIGGGAAAYSSSKQSSAAKKATQAQVNSADANARLQREIYYQNRNDLAPNRAYEQQQLGAIGELFGFSPYQQPAQQSSGFASMPSGKFGSLNYEYMPQMQAQNAPAASGQTSPSNGLSRYESSPFFQVAMNDYQLADDRLGDAFGAQGLNYSSARLDARENARANIFSSNFNNYVSALMGAPPQGATNAGINNANAFLANSTANNMARGNALADGAIAQGNAAAYGASGLASAAGQGLGMYGAYKGWF